MPVEPQIAAWFAEADVDGDARVSATEAKHFFKRSGLQSAQLGQIWSIVKAHHNEDAPHQGLDKQQFSDFLTLVGVAQAGHGLDEDTVELALQPAQEWMRAYGTPLPVPTIHPAHDGVTAPSAEDTNVGMMHGNARSMPPSSLIDAFTAMHTEDAHGSNPAVNLERAASGSHRPPPPLPTSPAAATRDGMQGISSSSTSSRKGSFQPRRPAPVVDVVSTPAAADISTQDDPVQVGGPLHPAPSDSPDGPLKQHSSGTIPWELGSSTEVEPPTPAARTASVNKALLRPSRPAPVLPTMHEGGSPLSPGGGGAQGGPSLMQLAHQKPTSLSRSKAHVFAGMTRRFSEGQPTSFMYLEVRLPPLDPTRSGQLLFLAAGFGSLFGGPVHLERPGLMLQWGRAEGNVRWPDMPTEQARACESWQHSIYKSMTVDASFTVPARKLTSASDKVALCEDADAAPSCPVVAASHKVGCIHIDEPHGLLWIGDRDGYVAAFDLSAHQGSLMGEWKDTASTRPAPRYCFPAFSAGSVTAIMRVSTGALWAGSARGSLRVFEFRDRSREPAVRRELRRGGPVLGPVLPRAHQRRVLALVSTHDGRVVWSVTSTHLCLWCVSSGIFMGELARKAIADLRDVRDIVVPHAVQRIYQDNGKLMSDKGLVGGDGTNLDDCAVALHSLDRTEAAVVSQVELIGRSDNALNETLTFGITNAKQIGKTLVKTGGKGVKKLLDAASKGIMKAGRDVADTLIDDALVPGQQRAKGGAVLEDDLSSASSMPLERVSSNYPGSHQGDAGPSSGPPVAGSTPGEIVAVTAAACNTVWVGCDNGLVDQYSSYGRLLNTVNVNSPVLTLTAVGERVWAGLGCGAIIAFETAVRVIEDGTRVHDVKVLHRWEASPVGITSLTPAGTRVYSLALDGRIRGWPAAAPCHMDAVAWDRWQSETQHVAVVQRAFKIFAVTWNVNELQPDTGGKAPSPAPPPTTTLDNPSPPDSPPQHTTPPATTGGSMLHSKFFTFLQTNVAGDPTIKLAVVGLQEIEMGSTSVAAAAARDLFGQKKAVERGNQVAQAWAQRLLVTMNSKGGGPGGPWYQVGMRQLCGIFVCVFARVELRPVIGEVATAHVTTGVLGNRGGNKGAAALRFTIWRRTFTVIASHFAAHQHNIEERNANYQSIVRRLKFKRHIVHPNFERVHRAGETAKQRSTVGALGGERGGVEGDSSEESDSDDEDEALLGEEERTEAFRTSEAVVWLGDFNYRLDLDYTTALSMIADDDQRQALVAKDQCIEQMKAGKVFVGLAEGPIRFLPTYKFDKPGTKETAERVKQIHGYDSSEKRRVPSYTDRIFFRGTQPMPRPGAVGGEAEVGDLLGMEEPEVPRGLGPVSISCERYDSMMDVVDSDHKPVYVMLRVEMNTWDEKQRRRVSSHLLKQYYRTSDKINAEIQPGEGSWGLDTFMEHTHHDDDDDSESDDSSEEEGEGGRGESSSGEGEEAVMQSRGSGSGQHTRRRDRLKAKAHRFAKNISKWSSSGSHGEQKTIPLLTLPSGSVGTLRLANRGESPVLFRLVQAQYWSGFDRCITVWPATGYVAPHSTITLRVSGAEARQPKYVGTLRSAFEVLVTGEYSVGGEMAPLVLRFAVQLCAGGGEVDEAGW